MHLFGGDSYLLDNSGGQVSSSAVTGDADTLGVYFVSGEDFLGQEVLRCSQAVQVLYRELHLWIQTIPTQTTLLRFIVEFMDPRNLTKLIN